MSTKTILLTRKAAMVMGGIAGFMKPRMAKDAQIDWRKLLGTVTSKNFAAKKGVIVAGLKEQTKGKLAKDASIDGLVELLDGFEKIEDNEDAEPPMATKANSALPMEEEDLDDETMDADPRENLKGFLAGKGMSEDDINAACDAAGLKEEPEMEMDAELGTKEASEEGEDEAGEENVGFAKPKAGKDKKAKDEPPPFKGKPKVGGGMDAVNKAIAAGVKQANDAAQKAIKEAKQEATRTREAERFVRPWIGDLAMAHDSAEEVYRTALTALNVDVKDVHPSAFKAILSRVPQPGKHQAQDETLAMDTDSRADFKSRWPTVARIQRV